MTNRITVTSACAIILVALRTDSALAVSSQTPADHKIESKAFLSLMHKVNNYQEEHPWRPDDRNWIRATYYTGVMAFYRTTGDGKVLRQALDWAEKHRWQPGSERSGGNVLKCGARCNVRT